MRNECTPNIKQQCQPIYFSIMFFLFLFFHRVNLNQSCFITGFPSYFFLNYVALTDNNLASFSLSRSLCFRMHRACLLCVAPFQMLCTHIYPIEEAEKKCRTQNLIYSSTGMNMIVVVVVTIFFCYSSLHD